MAGFFYGLELRASLLKIGMVTRALGANLRNEKASKGRAFFLVLAIVYVFVNKQLLAQFI